jgi:hypothetical protein
MQGIHSCRDASSSNKYGIPRNPNIVTMSHYISNGVFQNCWSARDCFEPSSDIGCMLPSYRAFQRFSMIIYALKSYFKSFPACIDDIEAEPVVM